MQQFKACMDQPADISDPISISAASRSRTQKVNSGTREQVSDWAILQQRFKYEQVRRNQIWPEIIIASVRSGRSLLLVLSRETRTKYLIRVFFTSCRHLQHTLHKILLSILFTELGRSNQMATCRVLLLLMYLDRRMSNGTTYGQCALMYSSTPDTLYKIVGFDLPTCSIDLHRQYLHSTNIYLYCTLMRRLEYRTEILLPISTGWLAVYSQTYSGLTNL